VLCLQRKGSAPSSANMGAAGPLAFVIEEEGRESIRRCVECGWKSETPIQERTLNNVR
jgi:hypothetical protein